MWTKEAVKALLDANPLAVERAIVAIYQRQTADERASGVTRWKNGIGFAAVDANRGAYMARWILGGKHLSGKWLEKGRHVACRYVRQLADIANEKAEKETAA